MCAQGLVSTSEFKAALKALGYEAPRAELDAVFAALDQDGGGHIEVTSCDGDMA